MTTYVVLLRAVNLAGRNMVGMADLREMVAGLGMQDVRSLLQSGNLVFRGRARSTAQLERALEDAAGKHLGLETDMVVRTPAEWRALIADNPFPEEAREDPAHLVAFSLKGTTDRTTAAALQKTIVGREIVRAGNRCAYIVYPDGIGRSRLTSAIVEKALGSRGTGRNWNTVLKIAALVEGS